MKLLVVASFVWPLTLGGAVWDRASTGGSVWTHGLYAAASRICHQRPERSFHSAGVKWPVCGRCSGLYLAAPVGALAALAASRRRHRPDRSGRTIRRIEHRFVPMLVLASLPTAITIAGEWLGVMPTTPLTRAIGAIPLGAAIAFVITRVASGPARPIEYTGAG